MAKLAVNVDHVASVRQARLATEPDPVTAAALAEIAGAQGIVVHLREDRRHIQDRDVELLAQVLNIRLNLEMAAADEIIGIARRIRRHTVCFVPEKRVDIILREQDLSPLPPAEIGEQRGCGLTYRSGLGRRLLRLR